jgi:hypothetical protein
VLDAADVENPETTSDVVEIYSQKQIPKDLAGKPDGWNRNLLPPYGIFVLSDFSKQWCIVRWSISDWD